MERTTEHPLCAHAAAVSVHFHHVFSRVGPGRVHGQQQRFVHHTSTFVHHVSVVHAMALRQPMRRAGTTCVASRTATKHPCAHVERVSSGDAHHRHRTLACTRRHADDGVFATPSRASCATSSIRPLELGSQGVGMRVGFHPFHFTSARRRVRARWGRSRTPCLRRGVHSDARTRTEAGGGRPTHGSFACSRRWEWRCGRRGARAWPCWARCASPRSVQRRSHHPDPRVWRTWARRRWWRGWDVLRRVSCCGRWAWCAST
mmetsp:Transcript_10480/g.64139  ORF Transcript_10480/g.64139 Transcript_10480/m.64139 type:complete len:260 (-) Transcript_10480:4633-5412(-)